MKAKQKVYKNMFIVLCLLLMSAFVLPLTAQDDELVVIVTQVDNDNYPEVTIYLRIENQDGELAEDLPEKQFTIYEDGEIVAIEEFRPGVVGGVSAVLTLDRSSSMNEEGKMQGAKNAAIAYINQMRPQDQSAITAFDESSLVVQPFTSDRSLLREQVQNIRTGACTALYDGLYDSAELVEDVSGRAIIIFVTDGIDCSEIPEMSSRGSVHTLEESLDRAYETGIPVHVIGLGDRGTSDIRTGIDEDVLRRISSRTDGNYYYTPTTAELEELYESIAVETQNEYVITYESPRPNYDGTRRDISVEIDGEASGTAEADYLEEHLLNIQSSWLIGIGLFVPLLFMLAPPLLWARRPKPQIAQHPSAQPQIQTWQPPPVNNCPHCGQPVRLGAKFCASCGQTKTERRLPVCTWAGKLSALPFTQENL